MRAATRMMLTVMLTIVVPGIEKDPIVTDWNGTTEVNIFGSEPKIKSAEFWRK